MNSDFELKTLLTADASQLNAAMRNAEKDAQNYVRTVQGSAEASKQDTTAQREAAQAMQAVTAARAQFVAGLREQVALYGKSAEQVLRYRAAQAGVGAEAAPLILQLQNQRAAQQAAAEAATREAAAQREAAQARQAAAASQAAFLNGLREQVALQGKSGGEVLRYRAEQLGIGPEASKYIDQYEAAMRKSGITAGQTAQAMRMLPAQITDITTSLAAGMPVWMVAIQQGGQIKDSFGGVGPAFTAIRAAITPMIAAAAAGVGTVGLLALAYARGSAEADAYTRSILMSGNAAGTTVSRLTSMAERMDKVAGTQAQAADALAQLTATGAVANRNLEMLATTTVRVERVLGESNAEMVKTFDDLGRKPLEASVKLNQQYGYLTSAVYDRIKALQEQKRMEEAGEVAQLAFAKAMDDRTRQIEANAGSMERAWRGVKDGAAEAWDAMLGIGRKKTTQQDLDSVAAQLQALDTRKSNNPALTQQRRDALLRRQTELQQQIAIENNTADVQAAARTATTKHIQGSEDGDKEHKAAEAAAIARVKSQLDSLTGAYGDAERILEVQHQAALISDAQYWEAKRAFIALTERAQLDALAKENSVLIAQKALGADKITRDSQVAQNSAEMARVRAKAAADTVIANAQEAASLTALQRAQNEYQRQLQETMAARDRQQDREMSSLGRGDQARGLAAKQNALEDRYLQQRQQLDSDRLANRLTEPEYQARLAALKTFHQLALQSEVRYQDERQQAEMDGTLGMQRALENYLDSARNVAGQTERMFTNTFQSMEDGVVRYAMTGKGNFRSLAESAIADLTRIYVRQQMLGFMGSLFSSFTGMTIDTSGIGITGPGQTLPTSGGRAGGGAVDRGSFHPVNERGPELLTVDGKDYLMMGSRGGQVVPNDRSLMPVAGPTMGASSGGGGVNITMPLNLINNTGTPARATAQRRSDGGFDVILEAIESGIAANVANGSGPMARAVEGRYGLTPSMST